MNNYTGPILLVEDNEDDIFFMKRALRHVDITDPVQVVRDGQQAIDYLAGNGDFKDRQQYPFPCLIFLDLKLPGKNGLEVLEWVRKESPVPSVVVLVLTTSRETSDIDAAYRLCANAYLVKPGGVEELQEMIKTVKLFWLGQNQFPLRT